MSGQILTTALLGQQHDAPAGAHFVLLAGVVATALVLLGVRWWRRRRDVSRADESTSHDHSAENTESAREE